MAPAGRPKRDDLAIVNAAAELWGDDVRHEIGFMGRVFTQTSMPYRNPGDDLPAWVRQNGNLTLTLQPGPPSFDPSTKQLVPGPGYPYGTIPRLLVTWLSTEAVRRKERVIPLGETLSDFMRQLDLGITGGKTGTIGKLRDQTRRLFQSRIAVVYRERGEQTTIEREAFEHLSIARKYDLWWSNRIPDQAALMPSYVELSEAFFEEVTTRPVPVSLDVLRRLRGSPMRLDIYAWLTYRMSYLRWPTTVPWESLMIQFGTGAQTDRGKRKFQSDFERHLAQVLTVYPAARVEATEAGVMLRPSPTHVRRRALPGGS